MTKAFVDHVAETRDDFNEIIGSATCTIIEVYKDTPNAEMESLFEASDLDANLIRFDMTRHSSKGRARFCSLNDFERQCYGLPVGVEQRPLPYFSSYVSQIGPVEIAWSLDEAIKLLAVTKENVDIINRINKKKP